MIGCAKNLIIEGFDCLVSVHREIEKE
jgi:hypothetical protein